MASSADDGGERLRRRGTSQSHQLTEEPEDVDASTSMSRSQSTSSSTSTGWARGNSTPHLGRGGLSFTGNDGSSVFSSAREEVFGGGLPLFDLLVSVDAHLDLLGRRIKPLTDEWRARARQTRDELDTRIERMRHRLGVKKEGSKSSRGADKGKRKERKERDLFRAGRREAEKEFKEFREQVKLRVKTVQDRWNDSKTVALRDKISFFCSVNNLVGTCFLLAFWPQYIPLAYSLQAVYYLPLRIYSYKRIAYHYFLFDLCYYVNALTLLYLWVFPSSPLLFEACYGLSHGPLASAIATWRNSLVFHSLEKVTSLFIHIYPPLVFTVLRHYNATAAASYPAVAALPQLSFWRHFAICSVLYLLWQGLYYQFVMVWRASKIASGGRVTSFTWLLNSKKGVISNLLHKIRPERRAASFIAAQYVYTVITMLPGYLLLYNSKTWSGIYLWAMFAVSVWNGASFYLEVFGRRFEKELNQVKRELDELNRGLAERQKTETAPSPASPTASAPTETIPPTIAEEEGATPSISATASEAYDSELDTREDFDDDDESSAIGTPTSSSTRPVSRQESREDVTLTGGARDLRDGTPRPPSLKFEPLAAAAGPAEIGGGLDDGEVAAEEGPAIAAAALAAAAATTGAAVEGDKTASSSSDDGGHPASEGSGSWVDVVTK